MVFVEGDDETGSMESSRGISFAEPQTSFYAHLGHAIGRAIRGTLKATESYPRILITPLSEDVSRQNSRIQGTAR